jgi:hypothetical protein
MTLEIRIYFLLLLISKISSRRFDPPTDCDYGILSGSSSTQITSYNEEANIRDLPFMASYGFLQEPSETDWQNVCAASILSKNILMTAAHCIRSHESKRKVLLGQSILDSETLSQQDNY